MKNKNRKKVTPATISEIIAAMKALGVYSGKNTRAEQEQEAKRLGGKEYYRLRLVNALLGIVETEAMLSEVAIRSTEEMLHAHQQALESSGAMDSNQKLLGFLRWRTLRIEWPLKLMAQDRETGPIPLAAAWAAEGLQQLLGFCVNEKHTDPVRLDPVEVKNELNKARESLMDGVANIDIMLDLLGQAEESVKQTKSNPKTEYSDRTVRASKLLLLDMYVPFFVERKSSSFFLPSIDWSEFDKRARAWGIWTMTDADFIAFEERKMREFTKALSAVSGEFPFEVFSKIDQVLGTAAKMPQDSPMPRISELLSEMGQTRDKLFGLVRKIEPEMISRFRDKPTRNPLEALLILVDALLEKIKVVKFPVPDEVRVELVRLLALEFTFSSVWPYTQAQMQSALAPGHPDWRPDIPREHILVTAREVEKLLITKLKEEELKDQGVSFHDASQAGMAVIHLTVETLFGKAQVMGADMHEAHFVALVLVRSYQFSPSFPYQTEQIREALKKHFDLEPYLE